MEFVPLLRHYGYYFPATACTVTATYGADEDDSLDDVNNADDIVEMAAAPTHIHFIIPSICNIIECRVMRQLKYNSSCEEGRSYRRSLRPIANELLAMLLVRQIQSKLDRCLPENSVIAPEGEPSPKNYIKGESDY
uniref:Uncharacterized protein n=1 Tax=Glossina austeni TaxID=7395 RepID=A0A1A9VTH6_GLOAU